MNKSTIRLVLKEKYGVTHQYTENEVVELLDSIYKNTHNNFVEAIKKEVKI